MLFIVTFPSPLNVDVGVIEDKEISTKNILDDSESTKIQNEYYSRNNNLQKPKHDTDGIANAVAIEKVVEKEEVFEEETLFPDEYLGSSTLEINSLPKGGMRFKEWKDGETPFAITKKLRDKSDQIAYQRRERIKNAMIHAWEGYKDHAFGHDEVKPVTGGSTSHWGGLGVSLVDALDTLWLMDLKDLFYEGRDWVRDKLNVDVDVDASVFETTIRSLGGLLSAYSWSGDESFLNKAKDIGARLFKAFPARTDDDRLGLPYGQINLRTGRGSSQRWLGSNMILSEIGSLQIEFRDLASVTGNEEYARKSDHVFEVLKQHEPSDGLYPSMLTVVGKDLHWKSSQVSFGAFGDSFYEYELKLWLQGGKKENMYREMYDKSIDGMHSRLLKTSPSGLWYIASQRNQFEHLTCFMGGVLALGGEFDDNLIVVHLITDIASYVKNLG